MSKKKKPTKDGPITGLDGIQKAKVRQDYTEKELVEMGTDLANALDTADRLKNDLDEVTIRLHARIESSWEAIAELAHEIRLGYKWVEVDVKAEFDARAKRKKLYTLDGVFFREEPMLESDYQVGLPFTAVAMTEGGGDELPAST